MAIGGYLHLNWSEVNKIKNSVSQSGGYISEEYFQHLKMVSEGAALNCQYIEEQIQMSEWQTKNKAPIHKAAVI